MIALGIIIGILLSILVAILNIRYASTAERTYKQLESLVKTKGKLLDPIDETITNWIESLPTKHDTAP